MSRRLVLAALSLLLSFAFANPRAFAQTGPPPTVKFVPPKLHQFVEAEPPAALATRKTADVILSIDVDDTGKVVKVEVATPGPAGEGFDEAAITAAKQFEFDPGTADGKNVPVKITYRYHFFYKEPPPPPAPETPTETATPVLPSATDQSPFLGKVLSKGDRIAMPGVTVFIDDEHNEITDDNGRFRFAQLAPGEYKVKLRGAEIRSSETKLKVIAGKQLDTTYYVEVKRRYVTTVRAARPVEDVVVRTLSGDEIRHIPGTQGDALKAVQNLPGVARSPFGGGLLVVWGSSPQDTRVYTDGVLMPTLYHFGGLRSVVNSEIVDSLTFMPGGYGVEYGRGMGGVVQVTTRKPKEVGYHGYAQVDLIDASFLVEGPITKKLSFSVSARRSLLDLILPHVTGNNLQLTPVYYDYQTKLHYRATPRDDLELFIFGSDDALKLVSKNLDPTLAAQFNSHIYFHRFVGSWKRRIADGATLDVIASAGYDQPFQISGNFGNVPFQIGIAQIPWALRATLRQPVNQFLRLDVGVDYEGSQINFSATAPASGPPREGDDNNNGTSSFVTDKGTLYQNNGAFFVAANLTFWDKRLIIIPQLRIEVFNYSGYAGTPQSYNKVFLEPEPRLNLRFQATKWLAIKAAVGKYDQLPDVATFAASIGNPNARPQMAYHYVLGFEFRPTATLSIDMQGFYKDLSNLVVRSESTAEPPLNNDGHGRVYGGEFLIKQMLFHNFYGWISYTISRSERKDHDDLPWRTFQYDQTHILTVIASYMLPRGFQIGARFRYVTGNPYTPVIGSYFNSNIDGFSAINGPVYSSRLPAFQQLDIRLDKQWTYNLWKLGLYLDIQNVYNYRSAEGYSYSFDYSEKKRVQGLPFLPALGMRGDF